MFLPLPSDRLAQRFVRCIAGLGLFGLGICMFLASDLGVAPWDVLHLGIENKTGIPVGIVIEITGVLILLMWIPLRQRMGWGTALNAIEIGLVVLLVADHLPQTDLLLLRFSYLALGLVIIGVGSGLYIGSGLGSGPRDGLMLGLAERGFSVSRARTALELAVLATGIALGGSVGVGTAVFTFGIGPVVQYFLPRLRLRGDVTVLATAH